MKKVRCERCNRVYEAKRTSARFCSDQCREGSKPKKDKFEGWVYIIGCQWGDTHWVKIGYTEGSPWARLNGLQTGNPLKLKLWAFWPGPMILEAHFHTLLKRYQTQAENEWFEIDPQRCQEIIWEDKSWR